MSIKLAMSILVRDEIDIIKENILFHQRQGVSKFIVTDNGSVDGTRDVLEDLKQSCDIHIIDEPEHTINQDIWVTRMAFWLRENSSIDWVINNDADEFWWSRHHTLPRALELELNAHRNSGVVNCDRFNYLPTAADVGRNNYRFYNNTCKVVRDPDPSLRASPDNILITTQEHKVVTRLHGLEKVGMGNHRADHEGAACTSEHIQIAHYPLRSYEQFEKKVSNHGSSIKNNTRFGPAINWHLRYWYEQYRTGKLEQEYMKYVLEEQQVNDLLLSGTIVRDNSLKRLLDQPTTHMAVQKAVPQPIDQV
jgi:hypothetical protein